MGWLCVRIAHVKVLVPLPDRDFDVTEVSVPWHVLTDAGHTRCAARSTTRELSRSSMATWAPEG